LFKKREPLPALDAIYIMQPDEDAIEKMCDDFESGKRLYRCAHVFFTSS
jgi:syntaxin-binding protein 1